MSETKHTPGLEFYHIDSLGGVWAQTGWRGEPVRRLAQHPNSHGYLRVRMVIDGKRVSKFVHLLVAAKYLPPRPSPKHEVRHLDGDKTHNAHTNLAWGTRKENAADRELHGHTSRGEKHAKA